MSKVRSMVAAWALELSATQTMLANKVRRFMAMLPV
jgi:hypothetical protein